MNVKPKVLASFGEENTYRILREYLNDREYEIYKEVKVSQVIEATRDELTSQEWSYYTRAAFDFVVCPSTGTQNWELVIEFDGPQHSEPAQAERDRMKNSLCDRAGLPLIRLRTDHVLRREKIPFLKYMLDLYFGHRSLETGELNLANWEDEYFAGTEFDGTSVIRDRIHKMGVYPAMVPAILAAAEDVLWYRVRESFVKSEADAKVAGHRTAIDLMSGWSSPKVLFTIERAVSVTNCAPAHNVPGVHGWHIDQEIACFLAFQEFEKNVRRVKRGA